MLVTKYFISTERCEHPLDKNGAFYWKLFVSTFTLSAFTFGGGYVIVPLMRKKFAEELGWINQTEMMDMVAIAQSCPGPLAVNTSIMIGYRLAGLSGAFTAIVGTILPPLIIISIISFFYQAFRANAVVAAVLRGMQAGVAAVIIDVIWKMGGDIVREKNTLSIIIMVLAFAAAYWLQINVALIIIICGVIGGGRIVWQERQNGKGAV